MSLSSLAFSRSLKSSRLATQAVAVVLGSALIAAAAQIQVPMIPVPMTMQTFAVLAIGMLYGPRLAFFTLAAYVFEGVIGLPVFAGGANFAVLLAKPFTIGYIAGFVAAAVVAGAVAQGSAGVLRSALAVVAGTVALYVLGLGWLAYMMGGDVAKAVSLGLVPFLLGDAVKAALAIAVRESLGRIRF